MEKVKGELSIIPELEQEVSGLQAQVTKYKGENDRLAQQKTQLEERLSELEVRIAGYEQMESDFKLM